MQRTLSVVVSTVVMALLFTSAASAQVKSVNRASESTASGQPLNLNVEATSGHKVHIMPTHDQVKSLAGIGYAHNGGNPPLLYNGGPVMHTPTVYAIYWIPSTLQNGNPTSMSTKYQSIQTTMLKEYFGHSLMNNNTQYYDTKSFITNTGKVGGTYVDKSAYPASGCADPGVPAPGNCITDQDLQNEINKVMTLKKWTGGVNKMFLLFTSSNEGQCTDSSSTSCSYVQYCAYHSYFVNSASQDVVYGNEPYGNLTSCQVSGAPSPNSFPEADAAATAASHELTEAITDPLLDAWFDSVGAEIGDECAYFYGFTGWDAGLANELWDGHPFFLQTEYSNYLGGWSQDTTGNFAGCFNSGPEL
jgi:hypothetical protein